MMSGVDPGWPLVDAMRTPATLPSSDVIGSSDGTGSSSDVTRPIANGTFARSVASIEPVTTTSFSRFTSCFSVKFCVCDPTVRRIGMYAGLETDRANAKVDRLTLRPRRWNRDRVHALGVRPHRDR